MLQCFSKDSASSRCNLKLSLVFFSSLLRLSWQHPLKTIRVNRLIPGVIFVRGFALTENLITILFRGYCRRNCKLILVHDMYFHPQAYYLLFRYVHGHSIIVRVTSNSCKIWLQVFRVRNQAAVFLPPLLIMVSESKFRVWLWCRGAPHCFTSTNLPLDAGPQDHDYTVSGYTNLLPGCDQGAATRRSWDTDSKLKMLPAAVGGPILCFRVLKIRAIHDISSCCQ